MKRVTFLLAVLISSCLSLKASTEPSLDEYTATYKFPQGSIIPEVSVVIANGELSLSSTIGTSPIKKTTPDHFTIPNYHGTAVFVRNDAKKITGIKIEVKGVSIEGKRQEREENIATPLPIYESPFPIKNLPAMPLLEGEE
ncbi:hypothetical protein [Ferruginibacter sp.]